MKRPDSFLTNTSAPAGRLLGQAINDPGGDTGTGVDQEIYNDTAYALISVIDSYREGGITDLDEKTTASDHRDAIEEMVSKKVSGISDYNPATTYSAPGELSDLVMWKGFQFINISDASNIGNDPLENPELWYKIPKVDTLMDQFYSGDSISGGLSPLADRAGTKYLQNLLFGKYRLGGNGDAFYNFFRVHFDGTQVTGSVEVEAIFKPGLAGEYFNIDFVAPDVVGTRTLLDLGEYVDAPQSFGGENDTMGALVEDQLEDHDHIVPLVSGADTAAFTRTSTSIAGATGSSLSTIPAFIGKKTSFIDPNYTNPNNGATTHGKRFSVGISYMIVMQAA